MYIVVYNTVANYLYYTLLIHQYFVLKCILLKMINLFKILGNNKSLQLAMGGSPGDVSEELVT